jgi:hypothetical protein
LPVIFVDKTVDQIFESIYLNHPSKNADAHPYANQQFRRITASFFQIGNIERAIRTYNRTHRTNYGLAHATVYYSIYEMEDPVIVRALIESYRAGVSVVIITDRQNGAVFTPATPEEERDWTDTQKTFYLRRYDQNHNGIVDTEDAEVFNHRSRLMRHALRSLTQEIENIPPRPRQIFKLFLSPHATVPPSSMSYIPLHHSKIRMITVQGPRDLSPIPLSMLIGTGNDTFSCMSGDMREESKDELLRFSNILERPIRDPDFVSKSRGNVNLLMEINEPHLLEFILRSEILDSVAAYQKGEMFLPASQSLGPPSQEFRLKDGTQIRLGVTRGKPRMDASDVDFDRYDPNRWIIDFLANTRQEIVHIDRVVQSHYFFTHSSLLQALQHTIRQHNPEYLAVIDSSSAFLEYSSVLELVGMPKMTWTHGEKRLSSGAYPMFGGEDSPPKTLKVYSDPYDKAHLKVIQFRYTALDPIHAKATQTRYRTFLGSLNATGNGPNNREIFISVDSASPRLFKILDGYISSISRQSAALDFKEAYAKHVLRVLFRLPIVSRPFAEREAPLWETALRQEWVSQVARALNQGDIPKWDEALSEISHLLAPYSSFAQSQAMTDAKTLFRLFLDNLQDPQKNTPKHRWFLFGFLAQIHTDAFSVEDIRHIVNYYFGISAAPMMAQVQRYATLSLNHGLIQTALFRTSLLPVDDFSTRDEDIPYLMPSDRRRIKPWIEAIRDWTRNTLETFRPQASFKTLDRNTWRKVPTSSVIKRLVGQVNSLPRELGPVKSKLVYALLKIFTSPYLVSRPDIILDRVADTLEAFKIPDRSRKPFLRIFEEFQNLASKSPNFQWVTCNSQPP